MKRLLITATLLVATIAAAHAADTRTTQPQVKAPRHPHTTVVHRAVRRPAQSSGGYDENHGAYDPWYWDPSYGQ